MVQNLTGIGHPQCSQAIGDSQEKLETVTLREPVRAEQGTTSVCSAVTGAHSRQA